ncbi:hypothetical protein [Streptomyces albicerus]|uniref:hypothetical protein n=1 Tax=Streptomyces albicerus TaxID=2569859 RepID=UPI001CED5962|nr:hypothetical protein [Streptomyces albicerus]
MARTLDDGRRVVKHRCGYEWEHRQPTPPTKRPSYSFSDLKARFPKAKDVEPQWLERAARLKSQYLATKPDFDPHVAAYWAKYQRIFSPNGLGTCDPRVLKDFANSDVGARPGNQATFNSAWKQAPVRPARKVPAHRQRDGCQCVADLVSGILNRCSI